MNLEYVMFIVRLSTSRMFAEHKRSTDQFVRNVALGYY